ncbi:MauE/DoxX family redox-associated membrane protein [Galbibacter mesophilus]|uniref:MauE/DoxX family redox-associated membrane protein n=1 Tax=Galbibacter mesophilus TaxID=379069 RepID=UPI00191E3CBC|nr:MauE/DoxX family redox-associated membrane protein [Galbibacter mesophilus]MCM5663655.1 hypothetical protein [Galbibacter mesophilus]
MKWYQKYSKRFVIPTVYLFILLFTYTAISKLLHFQGFKWQLERFPFIGTYAMWAAPVIPFFELFAVLLLSLKSTRKKGLKASTLLLILYSIYIVLVLSYSNDIPCSCAGISRHLSWTQQLMINIIGVVLLLLALRIYKKNETTNYLDSQGASENLKQSRNHF